MKGTINNGKCWKFCGGGCADIRQGYRWATTVARLVLPVYNEHAGSAPVPRGGALLSDHFRRCSDVSLVVCMLPLFRGYPLPQLCLFCWHLFYSSCCLKWCFSCRRPPQKATRQVPRDPKFYSLTSGRQLLGNRLVAKQVGGTTPTFPRFRSVAGTLLTISCTSISRPCFVSQPILSRCFLMLYLPAKDGSCALQLTWNICHRL